jgi:hypothetical protein
VRDSHVPAVFLVNQPWQSHLPPYESTAAYTQLRKGQSEPYDFLHLYDGAGAAAGKVRL